MEGHLDEELDNFSVDYEPVENKNERNYSKNYIFQEKLDKFRNEKNQYNKSKIIINNINVNISNLNNDENRKDDQCKSKQSLNDILV